MSTPRLILKTHYQIGHPGVFSVLIEKCSSPHQSSFPQNIAKKLENIKFQTIDLNQESVKFAVSMARDLGFLTNNFYWDWRGHVIHFLLSGLNKESPDDYLRLSIIEKIIYLKYYLEADGAVILELCKHLSQIEEISRQELMQTPFIDEVFISIWEAYRLITSDLREKVQLRDSIERLKRNPYTPKVRMHKALTHIETLVHLGFLERTKSSSGQIIFKVKYVDEQVPVDILVKNLISIENMEDMFETEKIFPIINNSYQLQSEPYETENHRDLLKHAVLTAYKTGRDDISKMVSLAFLIDVVIVFMLTEYQVLPKPSDIEEYLESVRDSHPSAIRFHVNRYGQKSYVVISDKLL